MFFGFLLIVIGGFFLLRNLGIIPFWYGWDELWPLLFVAGGIAMIGDAILRRNRRDDKAESKS